jgi:hypothetical protein
MALWDRLRFVGVAVIPTVWLMLALDGKERENLAVGRSLTPPSSRLRVRLRTGSSEGDCASGPGHLTLATHRPIRSVDAGPGHRSQRFPRLIGVPLVRSVAPQTTDHSAGLWPRRRKAPMDSSPGAGLPVGCTLAPFDHPPSAPAHSPALLRALQRDQLGEGLGPHRTQEPRRGKVMALRLLGSAADGLGLTQEKPTAPGKSSHTSADIA